MFNKLDLNYEDYITTDDNNIPTPVLIGDSSKLKGLGWKPKYSINRILDEILNYQLTK